MAQKPKYDFSGYATKANLKCSDGRVILPDAFIKDNGATVPLVWQHLHNEPGNILGHAVLENRADGVYAYCSLNNSTAAQDAKEAIKHGDIKALSIYANSLIEKGKNVIHGKIREISLVIAGANPEAYIDNLAFEHGDGSVTQDESEAIMSFNSELELFHAEEEEDNQNGSDEEDNSEETVADVFETFNEKQKTVVYALIGKALQGDSGESEGTEDETAEHADGDNETIGDIFATMDEKQKKVAYAMIGEAIKVAEESDDDDDDEVEHSDDELSHHGVMGMKWGVRKDKDSSGSDRRMEKDFGKSEKLINLINKNYSKIYNKTAKDSVKVYAEINKQYRDKYGPKMNITKYPNSKITKDYMTDLVRYTEALFNKNTIDMLGKKMSPDISVSWYMIDGGDPIFVISQKDTIKHDGLDGVKLKLVINSDGLITKFKSFSSNEYEDNDEENLSAQHSSTEGDLNMKKNIFEGQENNNNGGNNMADKLSTKDVRTIISDARTSQSTLKNAFLAHGYDSIAEAYFAHKGIDATEEGGSLAHSITNIEYLFPDHKTLTNAPGFIARRNEWVAKVFNSARHTPFSRIKTIVADVTTDEARALGYIKGKEKKEEVFALLKRTTDPQTVYKKQKIDRDDLIDITDFDVVVWLRGEMRQRLEEELARAMLIGDGRSAASNDKIIETKIRPIATDAPLYTIPVIVKPESDTKVTPSTSELIDAFIRARKDYQGSGTPSLFVRADILGDMLLLKDSLGRRIYESVASLESALRVKEIVEVPVMEHVVNPDSTKPASELAGIMVNMTDYSIGADKGGAITMMDDFDIDFNQYKYLIETRISGALTMPHSAIAFWATIDEDPVVPGDDDDDVPGDEEP